MQIYHLSHIDLDGYACQFVMQHFFKEVHFYNSNYGREINDNFYKILNTINENLEKNPHEKSLFLISDLNLTPAQCEEFILALQGKNTFLLLLDHHKSGLECAINYEWYFMDDKKCATKLVYEFFAALYGRNERLEELVNVVNAVDLWLKEDRDFELGKVFLSLIAGAKELNRVMFNKKHNEYIFFLLDKARHFIHQENAHIELDNAVHFIKKSFFKKESDNTLGNLISLFVTELLSEQKDKFVIFYEDRKGLLTSNIGNTSVIGNEFLIKNPEFDFFLDISSKKTLSFRANNRVDVSLMAKKLVGGGGHKNASGGLFVSFKDSLDYDIIKAQIMDLITSKTGAKNG